MKLSKDAIARLRVVQKQILQSPEFYDQGTFGIPTPCGTVCCIAGWLHYNDVGAAEHNRVIRDDPNPNFINGEAQRILGVDFAPNLFWAARFWPEPFRTDYGAAKTALARAKVAVRRIDYCIETGE